jgi:hypothetical protein
VDQAVKGGGPEQDGRFGAEVEGRAGNLVKCTFSRPLSSSVFVSVPFSLVLGKNLHNPTNYLRCNTSSPKV